MYATKKALIEKQNPQGTKNEQELWHGTPDKAILSINMYGFNRSYCSDNSSKQNKLSVICDTEYP